MAETILKAENITKQYRKFDFSSLRKKSYDVLNGVDMEVHRGDIYGLVGQNGAGKTTMIRILTGLVFPTTGKLEIFGANTRETINKQRYRISGIVETSAFYPFLTAWDNMQICCIQRGIESKGSIDRAVALAGLSEYDIYKVKVKDFSQGMKQRLGIAMALLGDPELLVFDEPCNGLDAIGVSNFQELIQTLAKEQGITVLMSSHRLDQLDQLATCYGFMHKGKMIEQISAKELEAKCSKLMLIKVDDLSKAMAVLHKKLGMEDVEKYSRNTLCLYEHNNDEGEIMKALVMEGINVSEMMVEKESLEKYYFSLIRRYGSHIF